MIEEIVKIHDKFSLEIKLGFVARKKLATSDFMLNTWIFVPNSLDVNRNTYSKTDFYRDIKSNIRLITPVFLLKDLVEGQSSPYKFLKGSIISLASNPSRSNSEVYEFHIKMFLSILKSALREHVEHIQNNSIIEDNVYLVDEYISNIENIIGSYRDLRKHINVPTITKERLDYYLFGDEFMSNIIEQHTFKLVSILKKLDASERLIERLLNLISKEIEYKKVKGYLIVDKGSATYNRELVYRLGMLKKYAESELFLTANKKKDGVIIEQLYLSIAAGLSMIFATIIAFSFQQKYGNFTIPLFFALVVSYMLKDRIKDLGRYYFAHKFSRFYFDYKIKISLNKLFIGWSKEAMDFIPSNRVPKDVYNCLNRSPIEEVNGRNSNEQVILFKKLVRLKRSNLDKSIQYSTLGMNEIIRINLSYFTQKMDDPNVPLFALEESDSFTVLRGEKFYSLNLIMQIQDKNQSEFHRYRVLLNRDGIKDLEKM